MERQFYSTWLRPSALIGAMLVVCPTVDAKPTLLPDEHAAPRELRIPLGDETFDPYEALNGAISSRELCGRVPDSTWIESDGSGYCIRFFAHGLARQNPEVLVYIPGDVMVRTKKGVRWIVAPYRRNSPANLLREMENWAHQAGKPTVFLARPGIYGSSGDHNKRRSLSEVRIVDRALDEIKKRYRIGKFHLAGQSGGGHTIAALLNRRRDVASASIASGAVSVASMLAILKPRYATLNYYDPVMDVASINRRSPPKVVLLTDHEDRLVPSASQTNYVEHLLAVGVPAVQVFLTAHDKTHHILQHYALEAASLLAKGVELNDVERRLVRDRKS